MLLNARSLYLPTLSHQSYSSPSTQTILVPRSIKIGLAGFLRAAVFADGIFYFHIFQCVTKQFREHQF